MLSLPQHAECFMIYFICPAALAIITLLRVPAQAEMILKAMGLYRDDEIKTVTTAILRHSDKTHIHEPYDELLKDADVMDHCLYNTALPIAQWEMERYRKLLIEFGINEIKCV